MRDAASARPHLLYSIARSIDRQGLGAVQNCRGEELISVGAGRPRRFRFVKDSREPSHVVSRSIPLR
jgi:hypothetical protein